MTLLIGSLFTGYGGLDEAVEHVLDGRTVWHCDNDLAASKLLAHRWPTVPNLGDITAVEWDQVDQVDVITGGFPCQDVSAAGRRVGMTPDSRSGLWAHMRRAISVLRPRMVVIENVRGLLSSSAHRDMEPEQNVLGDGHPQPVLRAAGAVLGDLSALGYDAQWHGLRAADIGAPHARYRVFIVATDTRSSTVGEQPVTEPGCGGTAIAGLDQPPARDTASPGWGQRCSGGRVQHEEPQPGRVAAADAGGAGRRPGCRVGRPNRTAAVGDGAPTPTDPEGDGRHERWTEPTGLVGRPDVAVGGDVAADTDDGGRGRNEGTTRRGEIGRIATNRRSASRDGQQQRATTNTTGHGNPHEPDRSNQTGQPLGTEPRTSGGDRPRGATPGTDELGRSAGELAWGPYAPAIHRWEHVLGRRAPAPTIPGRRGGNPVLNPVFVEWMQGLPAGWVTDIDGLTRNDMLRLLGNGVVPQQAATALTALLPYVEQHLTREEAA